MRFLFKHMPIFRSSHKDHRLGPPIWTQEKEEERENAETGDGHRLARSPGGLCARPAAVWPTRPGPGPYLPPRRRARRPPSAAARVPTLAALGSAAAVPGAAAALRAGAGPASGATATRANGRGRPPAFFEAPAFREIT